MIEKLRVDCLNDIGWGHPSPSEAISTAVNALIKKVENLEEEVLWAHAQIRRLDDGRHDYEQEVTEYGNQSDYDD